MSKRLVKRVKRGYSPAPAAVVHPDVTEEDVARAAGMVPAMSDIAVTLRDLLPKGWSEMDVVAANGLESSLLAAVTAMQSTTFGDKNPKLAALGVAAIWFLGLFEAIVSVSLSAFKRARIDLGDNLLFVTKNMLSKEGMERFKSDEVDAMIDRICYVDGIDIPPLSSWTMNSQVKY